MYNFGHFILNLLNKPFVSLINFIGNDHFWKVLCLFILFVMQAYYSKGVNSGDNAGEEVPSPKVRLILFGRVGGGRVGD